MNILLDKYDPALEFNRFYCFSTNWNQVAAVALFLVIEKLIIEGIA